MGFFNGFPDTVLRRKADLVHGKVPAHQLPSFVDDVIEGYYNVNDGLFYEDSEFTKQIFYVAQDGTKYNGEKNKIYVDLNNGHDYRWSGTYFVDLHNNASFVDTTLEGTTNINDEKVTNSVIETGEVKTLKSNDSTIETANITNLTAENGEVKTLTSDDATIKELSSEKASLQTGSLTTVSTSDSSLVNKKYVDDIKTTLSNSLTRHIDNKENPHDSAKFNNPTFTGKATYDVTPTADSELVNKKYVDNISKQSVDPDVGVGYQKIQDDNLNTEAKTIVGAINEVDKKVNFVSAELSAGWNTVGLNLLYPISWAFLSSPYCYNENGDSIDFKIINFKDRTEIIDGTTMHAFDIYVSEDCMLNCATTESNLISGIPVTYAIVNYYYYGSDGKDLDTVTEISNENWSLSKTVGYGHSSEITKDGVTLVKFGGDNTGGGSANANDRFYESIYLNIDAIQQALPNEDITLTLYGSWYSQLSTGNIHVSCETYISDTVPTISVNNKIITLNSDTLEKTYVNANDLICNIPAKKGDNKTYTTSYSPAFQIILHKVGSGTTNRKAIEIKKLG